MTTIETFNRGDEVLSKFPGGSIMTVLAIEGLKVRCSDDQDRQYWFDTNLLERYRWTEAGSMPLATTRSLQSLHDSEAADDMTNLPTPCLLAANAVGI